MVYACEQIGEAQIFLNSSPRIYTKFNFLVGPCDHRCDIYLLLQHQQCFNENRSLPPDIAGHTATDFALTAPQQAFSRQLLFCRCAGSNPSCVRVPFVWCLVKKGGISSNFSHRRLGISMSTSANPNQVPAFRRSVKIGAAPTVFW